MDLYCERCGEPWEFYYVMNEMTPEEKSDFLHGKSCPACKGKEVDTRPFRAQLAAGLHDLLGDDLDGLAADMEDAEYMLGPEFWN